MAFNLSCEQNAKGAAGGRGGSRGGAEGRAEGGRGGSGGGRGGSWGGRGGARKNKGAAAKASAEIVRSQDRAARAAEKKGLGRSECPRGKVLRRAHFRATNSGKVLVPAACVADPLKGLRRPGELVRGVPKKPGLVDKATGRRKVIRVEPGRLEKHGDSTDAGDQKTRAALRAAIASEGRVRWLSLVRRLVLLSTWFKRKYPARSARVRADAEYVK